MFDALILPVQRRMLHPVAVALVRRRVPADRITLAGFAVGVLAVPALALGCYGLALVLILGNRLADGLDGAVARATGITDFGGYFDIVADFTFYAAIPLAFVLADPAGNGAAGAFVLASFYINAASFLGFAVLAEKARMRSDAQGRKSIYFSNGLLEGTETIVFFVALCLFPAAFAPLALIFGALCLLTASLRLGAAARLFRPR